MDVSGSAGTVSTRKAILLFSIFAFPVGSPEGQAEGLRLVALPSGQGVPAGDSSRGLVRGAPRVASHCAGHSHPTAWDMPGCLHSGTSPSLQPSEDALVGKGAGRLEGNSHLCSEVQAPERVASLQNPCCLPV